MRKVGSDTPSSDPASSSCDSMLLRLSAVYTPSGTPTTSASTAATSDSSSVAGRRDEQGRDGFALAQGDAEVALRGIGDEVAELDDGGLVQAQALTQLDAFGIGGVLAQHDGDGVADVLK